MAGETEISRGATWLAALARDGERVPGYPASLRVVDATLGGEPARFIAVVPDPQVGSSTKSPGSVVIRMQR